MSLVLLSRKSKKTPKMAKSKVVQKKAYMNHSKKLRIERQEVKTMQRMKTLKEGSLVTF